MPTLNEFALSRGLLRSDPLVSLAVALLIFALLVYRPAA